MSRKSRSQYGHQSDGTQFTQPVGSSGGYNTPNFNTYATPDGRVASGLGDMGPGGSGMLERYRQQQAQNNYNNFDQNQLRLGGAKPELQPQGTQLSHLDSAYGSGAGNGAMYSRQGFIPGSVRTVPGSEAATNNINMGGDSAVHMAAFKKQKEATAAYKALIARRSDRMAGRKQPSIAGAAAQPAPPAGRQTVMTSRGPVTMINGGVVAPGEDPFSMPGVQGVNTRPRTTSEAVYEGWMNAPEYSLGAVPGGSVSGANNWWHGNQDVLGRAIRRDKYGQPIYGR